MGGGITRVGRSAADVGQWKQHTNTPKPPKKPPIKKKKHTKKKKNHPPLSRAASWGGKKDQSPKENDKQAGPQFRER